MQKKNPAFQYQILAKEIGIKIKNGIYKPGEKLPSTRELHKKLNLSINTVYKAFIELEKHGLVEARPKSGYYVKIDSTHTQEHLKKISTPVQQLPLPPSLLPRAHQLMIRRYMNLQHYQ